MFFPSTTHLNEAVLLFLFLVTSTISGWPSLNTVFINKGVPALNARVAFYGIWNLLLKFLLLNSRPILVFEYYNLQHLVLIRNVHHCTMINIPVSVCIFKWLCFAVMSSLHDSCRVALNSLGGGADGSKGWRIIQDGLYWCQQDLVSIQRWMVA